MNWDDMRYLLAVAQAGSLKGAARSLGVDKTTVSRRLRAMEAALGRPLVEPRGPGLGLTDFGQVLHRHAEVMRDEMRAVDARIMADHAAPLGTVRLTSVPLIINHVLLPALSDLRAAAPGLRVELIAESRDLSLLRGEADIALRLARPTEGGQGVLARKLGDLDYAAYGARGAAGPMPWIGYEPRMGYLSHAAAIARAAEAEGGFAVAVNDAESLFQMVCAGHGRTLLPRAIADADARLVEVPFPHVALPRREVWLMVRRDLRELDRVRLAMEWVERAFAARMSQAQSTRPPDHRENGDNP
ncbi:LysR family transcriptional regulator [Ruegeria pomeroyi]|uniref:Transcriptional regulator, LysR family n=2 Tax=Ruegeria pomeroyi TaxID=89184 RepID=Q5LUG2_RUEPO|nr:LysR family transcriptional regulator [Ruegeria pomeroyi]AAV94392.1 transcriptional regulator, LysR family [Ruegeria pomeroyi DSS-3]NVK99622.1 LysR family transcriptional regulator [Ruegeria pomeroyi]NVL04069.1 LysR family transcriptional regulator [Ruegeria pomeroyi]QWV07975.1 LysR family transcriptional regulator [Ruegeria pomeroyi]